ncbi:MAG: hypothetical protein SCALA702_28180 [Melioribacteraceae bacterium]|nr:MAG: hypothetical protein SCALA702_28180 [Melioribacteraceae bacterium]
MKKLSGITNVLILIVLIAFSTVTAQKSYKETLAKYYAGNSSGFFATKYIGLQVELLEKFEEDYYFSDFDKAFTNENICLEVTPNNDGYLYVINEGTSGKLSLVYPQNPGDKNMIHQGIVSKIPDSTNWTFEGKEGVEILYLIYSNEKNKELEKKLKTGLLKADLTEYLLKTMKMAEIANIKSDFGKIKRRTIYSVTKLDQVLAFPILINHETDGKLKTDNQKIQSILEILNQNK